MQLSYLKRRTGLSNGSPIPMAHSHSRKSYELNLRKNAPNLKLFLVFPKPPLSLSHKYAVKERSAGIFEMIMEYTARS